MENARRQERWYFKVHGTIVGPISTEQLHELLSGRRIGREQVVWREDGPTKKYVRAGVVKPVEAAAT